MTNTIWINDKSFRSKNIKIIDFSFKFKKKQTALQYMYLLWYIESKNVILQL